MRQFIFSGLILVASSSFALADIVVDQAMITAGELRILVGSSRLA
jgi:hypothetical protein